MGFFDSFKEGFKEGKEQARIEREKEEKEREEWEKAHPNEDYNRHKILTRATAPPKPQKLYEPGHKDFSGPVKGMALINMFGTSDLDEVIEQCAPEFTKAMYGVRDKVYEQDDYKAKYYELKGRYEELLKQNQELLQIVKNK